MDNNITPLPWHDDRAANEEVNDIFSGDGELLAVAYRMNSGGYVAARANAAFIVKAVNMHGQLAAALDMLLDDIEEHRGIAYTTFDAEDFARGILAEAEGK